MSSLSGDDLLTEYVDERRVKLLGADDRNRD